MLPIQDPQMYCDVIFVGSSRPEILPWSCWFVSCCCNSVVSSCSSPALALFVGVDLPFPFGICCGLAVGVVWTICWLPGSGSSLSEMSAWTSDADCSPTSVGWDEEPWPWRLWRTSFMAASLDLKLTGTRDGWRTMWSDKKLNLSFRNLSRSDSSLVALPDLACNSLPTLVRTTHTRLGVSWCRHPSMPPVRPTNVSS